LKHVGLPYDIYLYISSSKNVTVLQLLLLFRLNLSDDLSSIQVYLITTVTPITRTPETLKYHPRTAVHQNQGNHSPDNVKFPDNSVTFS